MMTGALLCGGQSRRMGKDKAFLEYKGKPFICHLKDTLEQCFEAVLLIGGSGEKYKDMGLTVIPDIIPGLNCLGGIYTALTLSESEWTFIIACDMPLMNLKVMEFLMASLSEEDAVIPIANGFHQPLCAFYNKRCLNAVKRLIDINDLNLYHFLDSINVRYIPEQILYKIEGGMSAFTNINKPEDLNFLKC